MQNEELHELLLHFMHNLKFALRQLIKNPGFTRNEFEASEME